MHGLTGNGNTYKLNLSCSGAYACTNSKAASSTLPSTQLLLQRRISLPREEFFRFKVSRRFNGPSTPSPSTMAEETLASVGEQD